MYTARTHFWLVGLDAYNTKLIKKIDAMPRFIHIFMDNFSLDALKNDANVPVLTVVIIDEDFAASPEELRLAGGKDAKIIWLSERPYELSPDALSVVDEVWSKPLSPSLLRFYFSCLQERLKLEKDKWLAELYLENTINPVPDLIWYKDIKGAHLKVNDAFCDVVGKTKEDIAGRGHCYIWGLSPEEYAQGEYVCMETEEEVIQKGVTCVFDEQVKAPEGMRLLKTYKTPLRDVDGNVMGTVGVARNVTKEREYQNKILEMAQTDSLTGLANRRYVDQSLDIFLSRSNSHSPLGVLLLDVDNFKKINDTFGHQTGDLVLQKVSECIKSVVRSGDVAGRFGGDEFILLLPGADKHAVGLVANRLIESVSGQKFLVDHSVTFSVGGTSRFPSDDDVSVERILCEADKAMYSAKNAGKNGFVVFEESASV